MFLLSGRKGRYTMGFHSNLLPSAAVSVFQTFLSPLLHSYATLLKK
jgi:hypothetical protein